MAFNVTALQTYVEGASRELATKAVANAKTAKLLIDSANVTAGVKGSADIFKMDADVVLQDGSSCGRSANGSTTFSQKRISVSPLKDEQNFCNKAFYDKWFAKLIAKGQNPEGETMDNAFAQEIMDYRAAKIAAAVEALIWKGDTESATANLAHFDGLVKLLTADAVALTPTGADIIAKLQDVYTDVAVEIRGAEDFRIFVGEDKYDEYLIALANKNIYKATDDFTLFGTKAKLEPVSGLNGTGKVVASRISNFHLGIDGTGDADKAEMRYSTETKQWYVDFHFAVGVQVIEETEAYIGAL